MECCSSQTFVYFLGFIAFTIQLGSVIENYIFPTVTNTNLIEANLKDVGFPLIIKICIKPGFNKTAINEAGYIDIWGFFKGQSVYNRYRHTKPNYYYVY